VGCERPRARRRLARGASSPRARRRFRGAAPTPGARRRFARGAPGAGCLLGRRGFLGCGPFPALVHVRAWRDLRFVSLIVRCYFLESGDFPPLLGDPYDRPRQKTPGRPRARRHQVLGGEVVEALPSERHGDAGSGGRGLAHIQCSALTDVCGWSACHAPR
jgi:hypothetical protein